MSSKVILAFTNMYKQFNQSNNPVIVLNFEIENGFYDVNVSPDKREIFIKNEFQIINDLNTKLDEFFNEV